MCVNISINVFTWPWNATGERPEPAAHWNQLRERGFWGKLRGSWGPLHADGQIIWNLIPPNRHEDNRWLYMGYHLWSLLMVCDNTLTDLWSLTEKHMSSFLAYTCSIGRSKGSWLKELEVHVRQIDDSIFICILYIYIYLIYTICIYIKVVGHWLVVELGGFIGTFVNQDPFEIRVFLR